MAIVRASELNNRHAGSDIFIVGAGPQLNQLSSEARRFLASQVTIGLNRTQYFTDPTYFLSAYYSECLLAVRSANCGTAIHARPVYEAPLHPGFLAVRRQYLGAHETIPRMLDAACPTLLTQDNAAIMACHLALILGAKRIIFVGVEQNDSLHFYHALPDVRDRIAADLAAINMAGLWQNPDHPYGIYERVRDALNEHTAQLAERKFYKDDHTPTFRRIFAMLAEHGVPVIATTANSVVARAGAIVSNHGLGQ
jgi:hypothetical protein